MDIIKKFGDMVGEESIRNPEKARKLLLTGYRLQEKRLQLFPDRKLPASGQYVARVVMQNIIKALAKPDDTALVSIFVPGELLTAAGIHSVFRGGNVLLHRRNQVRAGISGTDGIRGLSGNHVLLSQSFSGSVHDGTGTEAQMYHLHKPCLRWKHDDVSLSEAEISDPGLLY